MEVILAWWFDSHCCLFGFDGIRHLSFWRTMLVNYFKNGWTWVWAGVFVIVAMFVITNVL